MRPKHALHLDGDRIGVVVASGEILDGEQPPGTVGSDSLVRLLREALHEDDIKAVVLRIDSPGGSMFASEVIRREIDALRKAGKPVVASMSSVAASGGYYIAMDANEIWASPATLTGSIGVFAVFPTVERTLDKFGITIDGVGTTPLADSLRLDRSLQRQAKEILQSSVEHTYSVFVEQRRDRAQEIVRRHRRGRAGPRVGRRRCGPARAGRSSRLVQGCAERRGEARQARRGLRRCSTSSRRSAGAKRSRCNRRRWPRGSRRAVAPERTLFNGARRWFAPLEEELARLSRFTDPKQVYYYCPCAVELEDLESG